MSNIAVNNTNTANSTPAADIPVASSGFSSPEAALALAHLQLEDIRRSSRKDEREARRAREHETRRAIADQRRATKLNMIMTIVVGVINLVASFASSLKKAAPAGETLSEAAKQANRVKDLVAIAAQGVSSLLGGVMGWSVAEKKTDAADHEAEASIQTGHAEVAANNAEAAENNSSRVLNHLSKIAEAEERARDAALF